MSRVANNPVVIPAGVDITLKAQSIQIKGGKGNLAIDIHPTVEVTQDNNKLKISARKLMANSNAMSGTIRALINNMVKGVSEGFEKRLTLVGVGYRAQLQGQKLSLTLGFSHPVEFLVPEGVSIETPSQTEVIVKGIDKQKVGQVAANIRKFRPPEPYKGKGIRYANEHIVRKDAKKK